MAELTAVQGIDVSQWQGSFDWSARAGKIGFAMAKATEGDAVTDPEFAANWDGMWALDRQMPRFAYSYFHASLDPVAQAAHLVATVAGRGLLAGDNFVLDVEATDETSGLNDGRPPEVTAAAAAACLREVNRLAPGHRVLVYTNPGFAEAGNCEGLGAWYLWVANYGVSSPRVPAPWDRWTFWQWSGDPLDLDRFSGSAESLRALTRMPDRR